jgi:hypothetical protein
MGAQYLLDSNVVIDFLDNRLPEKGILYVQGTTEEKQLVGT